MTPTDDSVIVPKDLLRRVKEEVDDLRTQVADLTEDAETLRAELAAVAEQRDAFRAERDALLARVAASGADADAATRLRHENGALQKQTTLLQDALHGADAERADLLRTHPAPPVRRSGGGLAPAPVEGSPEAVLCRAFVAWCRRGSPLISRPYLFVSFLREAAPGFACDVQPVFRARTSGAPTFRHSGDGAEHWLVSVGDHHALVPHPVSPTQFRELAPAFSGVASPDTLGTIRPATVDGAGDAFGLAAVGHVSTA